MPVVPYIDMYASIAFFAGSWYCSIVDEVSFEWDEQKNRQNQLKHGVPFDLAQHRFGDPGRVIAEDVSHSQTEKRYYCMGRVGDGILTVRFTYRKSRIRIIGAGYWRKGREIYEKSHQVHR